MKSDYISHFIHNCALVSFNSHIKDEREFNFKLFDEWMVIREK